MDWIDISTENCSVRRALDLIGEKWTFLLLRDASNGIRRFEDFRRHNGLSETVLTDRLRTLVRAGIFDVLPYREPGQRTRNEYRLSEKGWKLLPVLIALMQWGDEYLADPDGGPLAVVHKTCGHPVEVVVQCTHDHERLTHHDTRAVPGPGARVLESSAVEGG